MGFQPTDSAESEAIRSSQPVGMGGPERGGRHEQTVSFEAPANVRASRLLRARVKVNSTRQGTPRPTGPWSPKAFQHAAERKSNESGEVVSGSPVWPRSPNETMEYQAFAALSKDTSPVEHPAPRSKVARIMARRPTASAATLHRISDATRPVTSNNLTIPLTGPPDAFIHLAPHPASPALARTEPAAGARIPDGDARAIERHRVEKVVAVMLFLVMIGLVWLNLS